MKNHILEVESVQKSFNNKKIVSDVYLKLESNAIIGILGRNGSGKSTLFKIIFGLIPADNKFIRIDGITNPNSLELFGKISYLHQENFIPKHLCVQKVISLSLEKENLNGFYKDEVINSILNKNINQLSKGELRYLEVKIILNNSSNFVILDEPFNGLSPLQIDEIIFLIKQNSKQKGIIITDHNYHKVIEISTKLKLMKSGKLFEIIDKNQLLKSGYLPN